MKKTFVVTDPVGLHARPATALVNEAAKYATDIKIIVDDKEANLKSIMGVMSLGIETGKEFQIEVVNDDEPEAMEGLTKAVVESNIGEEK